MEHHHSRQSKPRRPMPSTRVFLYWSYEGKQVTLRPRDLANTNSVPTASAMRAMVSIWMHSLPTWMSESISVRISSKDEPNTGPEEHLEDIHATTKYSLKLQEWIKSGMEGIEEEIACSTIQDPYKPFKTMVYQHRLLGSRNISLEECIRMVQNLPNVSTRPIPHLVIDRCQQMACGALFAPLNLDASVDKLRSLVVQEMETEDITTTSFNGDVLVESCHFDSLLEEEIRDRVFDKVVNINYRFMAWARMDKAQLQTNPLSLRMPDGSIQDDDRNMASNIMKYYHPQGTSFLPTNHLNKIESTYQSGRLSRHPADLHPPDEVIQLIMDRLSSPIPSYKITSKSGTSQAYGELTLLGFETLLTLAPPNCVGFLDIGSGFGNTLFYASCKEPLWNVVGVEAIKDLVQIGDTFLRGAKELCFQLGIHIPMYTNFYRDVTTLDWQKGLGLEEGHWLIWANSIKWENGKMLDNGSVIVSTKVLLPGRRNTNLFNLPSKSTNWTENPVLAYVYKK